MTGKTRKPPKGFDPFLEALRDLGRETGRTARDELIKPVAGNFFRDMVGMDRAAGGATGELRPGESVSFEKQLEKTEAGLERVKQQMFYEQSLQKEVTAVIQEDGQQLQLKIQAVRGEIVRLGKSAKKLETAVKEAAIAAPVEPGVYHENFFDRLKGFLASAVQTVESAALWVQEGNRRAAKQRGRFWGKYKASGSKFFLSGEHYLTRSAG